MRSKISSAGVLLVALLSAGDCSSKELSLDVQAFDADGPLTREEIQYFLFNMKGPLSEEQEECLLKEAEARAKKVGDPEVLDPTAVELLPMDEWSFLGKFGRRLVLTQVIMNQAVLRCIQGEIPMEGQ